MVARKPDLILQSECARRHKISQASVKAWIDERKVKAYKGKGGKLLIDWNEAQHMTPVRRIANRPDVVTPEQERESGAGFLDLAKVKLKRETYLAHAAELEFKKASEELVSAEEVAKAWDAIAANVRRRMMVLPDRLAPLLAAEMNPRKVHNMLTEELHQALETLNRTPEELEDENASDEPSEPDENS